MKNPTSRKVRSLFLLGGVAAMMSATMLVSTPAHADKSQNLKYGAAALGVLGAVLAVKGKTLPAVAAAAGAYYAYEKAKDAKEEERYDDRYYRYPNDRYDNNRYGNSHYNNDYRYDNNRYDNRNRYDDRRDDRHDSRGYYGDRNDKNDRHDRNGYRYYGQNHSVR